MTEFPGKERTTFGLDNIITKLLKMGRPSASISRTVRRPNERRDRLFGLKHVRW